MEKYKRFGYLNIDKERGISIVLVAIFLVLFIGIAALAIDIGRYMVTKNELQNIADGAALAACRELGEIYSKMPGGFEGYSLNDNPADVTAIKNKAIAVGNSNVAGGKSGILILSDDIEIGTWWKSSSPPYFDPTPDEPHAVKVTVRRDTIANQPVATFFAGIFDRDSIPDAKSAVASLSGQGETVEGEVEIPVGISDYFFVDPDRCRDDIYFSPTDESCAAWNTFDNPGSVNDTAVGNLIDDLTDGTATPPATTVWETEFGYIGGNLSQGTFDSFLLLFRAKGKDYYRAQTGTDDQGNPVYEEFYVTEDSQRVPIGIDGTTNITTTNPQAYWPAPEDTEKRYLHKWETKAVVYHNTDFDEIGKDKCGNASGDQPIVGYVKVTIYDVYDAPEKTIKGKVDCDFVPPDPTHGGGGAFGVWGSIPNLVQ